MRDTLPKIRGSAPEVVGASPQVLKRPLAVVVVAAAAVAAAVEAVQLFWWTSNEKWVRGRPASHLIPWEGGDRLPLPTLFLSETRGEN